MQDSEKNIIIFKTKTGQEAVIRSVKISDVGDLTDFINAFSLVDSFTRFAGEQVSFEEEEKYIQSELGAIEAGDAVKLFCYVEQKLAGICDIHRDTSLLTRKRHAGILGIIVGKEFRSQGIGEHLLKTTIEEARKDISGLRMIKLDCFATNIPALSLYRKLGFREVGRVPRSLFYKNEYVDEVIMIKELE